MGPDGDTSESSEGLPGFMIQPAQQVVIEREERPDARQRVRAAER